jgi:hypothetical protein
MRKRLKLSRNATQLRLWGPLAAAVTLLGCIGGGLGLSACSNALKVSSQAGPTTVVPAGSVGPIAFSSFNLEGLSIDSEVVGLSYITRNRAIILLNNKSSIGLNLNEDKIQAVLYAPTPQSADAEARIFPFGKNKYWALSDKKVAHVVEADDGSAVVSRADVDFGGEPEVLAVDRNAILLRVGNLFKVLRIQGKFEFVFDGPLDFKGRTAPLAKIVGAGLIGENGFWLSDGERVISLIVRNPGQDPEIIPQKFTFAGAGNVSFLALRVVEKDGKLKLQGTGLAFRSNGKVLLRTRNLDSEHSSSNDTISDTEVVGLINSNCISCHAANASYTFKDALKVSSWKSSAEKLKFHLEANSMPPGGAPLETRQKLAQFLKSVSGVEVNIVAPSATSTPQTAPTPDPVKVNEFNNTYRALIRTSCVNNCHDHVFDEANDVTFDAVKRNAIGMKGRLDSADPARRMPRAPVTISAGDRTNLSNWLGTLNP